MASKPETYKKWWLKTKYGLTLEDFSSKLRAQDHKCAICQTEEPGGKHGVFQVDHDHETGIIRGLLCVKCNVGLGSFKDNIKIVTSALDYLSLYKA